MTQSMTLSSSVMFVATSLFVSTGGFIARALAQPNISPDAAAELAKSPKPPQSNQAVGIDIDRFARSPFESPVRVTHGVILGRTILTHGNPYIVGKRGAIMEFRKDLSVGTLMGFDITPLTHVDDEQFWYIEAGKGRLDDGEQYWDLKEGIGILIPPLQQHRITNTVAEPLQILMLSWEHSKEFPARKGLLVRDVHEMPLPSSPSHWNYFGTDFFSPEDGLHPNEQFAVVYMPPMTIAEPHAHISGWEEVWVKLPPDNAYFMLGSEVREMPPNTAFMAPPNNKTVHSVVNLSKDKIQAFMYLGHWRWPQGPHPERPVVKPKLVKDLR